jgi:hypothetical protein
MRILTNLKAAYRSFGSWGSAGESYRNVFGFSAGRGNWITVLAHAFKVELHRFADEFFHLVQRCPGHTQARKIRRVRTQPVADFS